MAEQTPNAEQLVQIDFRPPRQNWLQPDTKFRKGTYSYAGGEKSLRYLGLPNPRTWQPYDADWKLPPDWKQIILDGMKDRLGKFRSFRLFMDICVRCGACADKCHFYIGSREPAT
jgi:ferredoxin